MVNSNSMVTVITPTYNRAYILPKLFESLKAQTSKNFEWLIVDDGSADDTKTLVESWIKSKPEFNIQYIYQENAGKMQAHNTAVQNCKTEFFMCVDSDDYIQEKAIEILDEKAKEIAKLNNVAGIIGYKGGGV